MESTHDHPQNPTAGDDYLDTVSLLQEEIARLEAELRLRDELLTDDRPTDDAWHDDGAVGDRVEELSALLAERDETIGLLWEHVAATEQAEESRAAEWDQLHRWVLELEERLGDLGAAPSDPDEGRREAEALREQMEARRLAWESQRRRFEEEIATLQGRLDEASARDGGPALEALEAENRRLRDECRRLAAIESEAAEVAMLRERLLEVGAESDQRLREIQRLETALRGEQLQHEADQATHRSEMAAVPVSPKELGPHERVRVLREHLRELHAREEQERLERRRSSPLARLWHRSGAKK